MKLVKTGYFQNPNPTSISVGLSPALLITSWRLLWATRPLFDLGSFCHHHHCHHHHHYHYCHHYHCHHYVVFTIIGIFDSIAIIILDVFIIFLITIIVITILNVFIKFVITIIVILDSIAIIICKKNLSMLISFLQPVKCVKSSLVCNTFILFQHWALSDYCHDYCDFQYCHYHHHNSTNNIWE